MKILTFPYCFIALFCFCENPIPKIKGTCFSENYTSHDKATGAIHKRVTISSEKDDRRSSWVYRYDFNSKTVAGSTQSIRFMWPGKTNDPSSICVAFLNFLGKTTKNVIVLCDFSSNQVLSLVEENWADFVIENDVETPPKTILSKGSGQTPLSIRDNKGLVRLSKRKGGIDYAYYFDGKLFAKIVEDPKSKKRKREFYPNPQDKKSVFVEVDEDADGKFEFVYWNICGEMGGGIRGLKDGEFFPVAEEFIPFSPKYNPKTPKGFLRIVPLED